MNATHTSSANGPQSLNGQIPVSVDSHDYYNYAINDPQETINHEVTTTPYDEIHYINISESQNQQITPVYANEQNNSVQDDNELVAEIPDTNTYEPLRPNGEYDSLQHISKDNAQYMNVERNSESPEYLTLH